MIQRLPPKCWWPNSFRSRFYGSRRRVHKLRTQRAAYAERLEISLSTELWNVLLFIGFGAITERGCMIKCVAFNVYKSIFKRGRRELHRVQ